MQLSGFKVTYNTVRHGNSRPLYPLHPHPAKIDKPEVTHHLTSHKKHQASPLQNLISQHDVGLGLNHLHATGRAAPSVLECAFGSRSGMATCSRLLAGAGCLAIEAQSCGGIGRHGGVARSGMAG